jgi:hypothetical protein
LCNCQREHTPRLDVHSDNRLSSRLGLALLLLLVLGQTLISDSLSLGIFFLVITPEQVDLIVIFLRRWSLCGVQREGRSLWAVGCVCLGSVTRESGKLLGVRSDVLVPSRSVGVFCGIWGGRKSLEGDNIGLGRRVSVQMSILRFQNLRTGLGIIGKENSEVHLNALVIVI